MDRRSWAWALCLAAVPACAGSTHSLIPDESRDPPRERRPDRLPLTSATVPDPARGQSVSLEELLAYADLHAPDLIVARTGGRARAAAERVGASLLLPDEPFVSVAAGRRRAADGRVGWDLEASVQQRVEVGGQRGTRRAAAQRASERIEADILSDRWNVHQRVHLIFHAAVVARERVRAAESVLAFSERVVSIAKKRLGAGDISRLQTRVAEGELAIAREKKLAANQEFLAARLLLAEVSGWPAERPPDPKGALDVPRRAPPAARLVQLARAQHPELRALRAAVSEAHARRTVADRDAWPDLTLGVSLAREADPEPGRDISIALVSLGFPLPLWRRNRGERAQAEAEVRSSRSEVEALASALDSRVRRAASAVDGAAARVEVYGSENRPAVPGEPRPPGSRLRARRDRCPANPRRPRAVPRDPARGARCLPGLLRGGWLPRDRGRGRAVAGRPSR